MISRYIIWKHQRDNNIKNNHEVIGLFEGTWEQADALVEKLNNEDPDVQKTFGGRFLFGYFRSEPPTINDQNYREYIQD